MSSIIVKRQNELHSKQWGVYQNGILVEGGFFTRDAADDAAVRLAAKQQQKGKAA